jgi:hypothetical protein
MKTMKKLSCLFLTALALMQGCSMFFSPAAHDESGSTLSSLSFNRTALLVGAGSMDILSLKADPPSMQPSLAVSWEFDSTIISALCDNYNAVITGLKPGTTTLRAQAGGMTAACIVTVSSDSVPQTLLYPYVSVNADLISLSPGSTEKVAAALAGGLPSDMNGFSYTVDKPQIASLHSEGNYLWITGGTEGIARISVRHNKAYYPYSFLVSCNADGQAVP